MLKLVVALAFVALCNARLAGNTYFVDVGYQHIKVANAEGDEVKFIVDQFYGFDAPQKIMVQLYGQNVPPKTIQYLDEQGVGKTRFQSDILYQIFNDFTGPLDEIEYEKLLDIVSTYVKNGQIHPAILYALQAVYGDYEALSYIDRYQGLYQQTPYEKLGFLFGKGYNRYGEFDKYYQKVGEYGVGSYYPSKYGVYDQLFGKRFGFEYPQKYYGSYYGPYSRYQFSRGIYGEEYPQRYGGYFGRYAAGRQYQSTGYYPQETRERYGPYAYGAYEYPSYARDYALLTPSYKY